MSRRLLWVDNDGPADFLYERRTLRVQHDWSVEWAYTIQEATAMLSFGGAAYDALIIDQQLPYAGTIVDSRVLRGPPEIWGGCMLLWWLRNDGDMSRFPQACTEDCFRARPNKQNLAARIVFLSSFWDELVWGVTQQTSDGGCEPVQHFSKPLVNNPEFFKFFALPSSRAAP